MNHRTPATEQAVTYLRVSTDKQAAKGGGEGFSIPAQREACKKKAKELGVAIGAEYVDAGESARSADRPELANMLTWIAEYKPAYVIVHKIDRLARNRADDVAINLEIRKHGATLISCTENIDETPSGALMHGMLSAFAEFYSANLANEVKKGALQKVKKGGTVGKAPVGYLNVREVHSGQELRTIAIDEERGPLVRQGLERYADGDISIRDLLDDLTEQGLTSTPGPKTPAKKLSLSQFHRLLSNPYYKGLVIYKGVTYPGNHTALVSEDIWDQVQRRLKARNFAGERKRRHHHYLKGTVFCGTCGSRLIISNTKNRHGTNYPYLICIGRQEKRTVCDQKALLIEDVERKVEAEYLKIQPKPEFLDALRAMIEEELDTQADLMNKQGDAQQRRKRKLLVEREKLLEAHYADAVPLDLLQSEQKRITAELKTAEDLIAANTVRFEQIRINLDRAINAAQNWHLSYRNAEPDQRREINQSVFERILVSTDKPTASEFAEPYKSLLSIETVAATIDKATETEPNPAWLDDELQAIHKAHQSTITWPETARKSQTPPLSRRGLSNCHLVPGAGLEPARRFPSRGV